MQLVLDSKGIVVKHRNGCFHIQTPTVERLISPRKISSIAVLAEIQLTTAAIELALEHKIPIYFHDKYGGVKGRLWSATFESYTSIRRNQVLFCNSTQATEWAISIYIAKLTQQLSNLSYLLDRKRALRARHSSSIDLFHSQLGALDRYQGKPLKECREKLMGIEGAAARAYWAAVADAMPEAFRFASRSKRPAADCFNASLNYLYGMMYTVVESALFSAGLDPYLGIIHSDQYQKPTLSFDLIEPFRPWVDRLLIDMVWRDTLKESYFRILEQSVYVSKEGKHLLIPAFLEFIDGTTRLGNEQKSRKALIYRKAGELAQILLDSES